MEMSRIRRYFLCPLACVFLTCIVYAECKALTDAGYFHDFSENSVWVINWAGEVINGEYDEETKRKIEEFDKAEGINGLDIINKFIGLFASDDI